MRLISANIAVLVLIIIVLIGIVYAHGAEEEEEVHVDTYDLSDSIMYVGIGLAIIAVFTVLSIIIKQKSPNVKLWLFLGIAAPTAIITSYLIGATITLNLVAETQGPVHWHADFEVWNCDERVELKEPGGLSNRLGTPIFHSHGDDRIHIEGVVASIRSVALHSFFTAIGGVLENDSIALPTGEGLLTVNNGDLCDGKQGKLQVFAYRIKNPHNPKNWVYEQHKLEDFREYIIAPYSNIPPGDCIIIEFGPERDKTDRLCQSYETAVLEGELSGS